MFSIFFKTDLRVILDKLQKCNGSMREVNRLVATISSKKARMLGSLIDDICFNGQCTDSRRRSI